MLSRGRSFYRAQAAQGLGGMLSGRTGGNLVKYALMGIGSYLVEEGIEKVFRAGEKRPKKRRR